MRLSHYHLVFRKEKHYVEMHWNLVKRYFSIDPEFWWKQTTLLIYKQQNIRNLSPENYLLYLIFRLYSHQFYPLKFFMIISAFLKKNYENINWKQFHETVLNVRMERLTVFTFRLISELWATRTPSFISRKKSIGYSFLKNLVLKGVFARRRPSIIKKIYFLLLLDSPGDVMKFLLRLIFPDKGEILLRYKIPEHSKKIYIYSILNPILLPLLVLKKGGRARGH